MARISILNFLNNSLLAISMLIFFWVENTVLLSVEFPPKGDSIKYSLEIFSVK